MLHQNNHMSLQIIWQVNSINMIYNIHAVLPANQTSWDIVQTPTLIALIEFGVPLTWQEVYCCFVLFVFFVVVFFVFSNMICSIRAR